MRGKSLPLFREVIFMPYMNFSGPHADPVNDRSSYGRSGTGGWVLRTALIGATALMVLAGPAAAAEFKCQPADQKIVLQAKPDAGVKLSATTKTQNIVGTVELAEANKQACASPQPEDHKAVGNKEAVRDK